MIQQAVNVVDRVDLPLPTRVSMTSSRSNTVNNGERVLITECRA